MDAWVRGVHHPSADCRYPVRTASIELEASSAHMGNFAPDGLTYYIGQYNRGVSGSLYIVDLAHPSNPKQLPTWQFLGDGRPHEAWLNTRSFTSARTSRRRGGVLEVCRPHVPGGVGVMRRDLVDGRRLSPAAPPDAACTWL